MAADGASSSLRRIGIPAEASLLLLSSSRRRAQAASPRPIRRRSPSRPRRRSPSARSGVEALARAGRRQAPVVTRTVVTPRRSSRGRSRRRSSCAREVPAKPAGTPAQEAEAGGEEGRGREAEAEAEAGRDVATLPPHDRSPVPLAAFIPTVEELDRGLLALAGAGSPSSRSAARSCSLAARRQLEGLAR